MIRTVTFRVLRPDGTPWEGGVVRFRLAPGSFTAEDQYPSDAVSVVLDEDGAGTADLWTNEEGEVASDYSCRLPSGETFSFSFPPGDGSDIDLSVVRLAGVTEGDEQYPTLLTYIAGVAGGLLLAGETEDSVILFTSHPATAVEDEHTLTVDGTDYVIETVVITS